MVRQPDDTASSEDKADPRLLVTTLLCAHDAYMYPTAALLHMTCSSEAGRLASCGAGVSRRSCTAPRAVSDQLCRTRSPASVTDFYVPFSLLVQLLRYFQTRTRLRKTRSSPTNGDKRCRRGQARRQ